MFQLVHLSMEDQCVDLRARSGIVGVTLQYKCVEKARDHVDWSILLVLKRIEYGSTWRVLMKECISIVRFSILLMAPD